MDTPRSVISFTASNLYSRLNCRLVVAMLRPPDSINTYTGCPRNRVQAKESAPIGLFAHLQAQLLARFFRGELDGYPALIWK
jgi:hypothetical protein